MFSFMIGWILLSIAVSIVSAWASIIPKYPKRLYTFLVHVIDTVILTVVLTVILMCGTYPVWWVICGLILMSLIFSVWLVNRLVRRSAKPAGNSPET